MVKIDKIIKSLIIFSILASLINSLNDALKFGGVVNQFQPIDFIWHCIKYGLQIPLWWFVGYYLILYIKRLKEKYDYWFDFWHPIKEHYYLLGILISNVIIWQYHYKFWRWIFYKYL